MAPTESAAHTPWHQTRASAWIALGVLWLAFVPKSLVVLLPLYGALARYRAHYRPLSRTTDPESKATDAPQIPIRGYLAVFPRVWALEGHAGIWKGAVPCIFYFMGLRVYHTKITIVRHLVGYRNDEGMYQLVGPFAAELAWVPFSVPLVVVLNREITHPQLRDWARWRSPGSALSSLFHREELACPKPLFSQVFLPLLAAESVRTAVIWGAIQAYQRLSTWGDQYVRDHAFGESTTLDESALLTPEFYWKAWQSMLVVLILMLSATTLVAVIVCPLEVAAVRISSQRAYPALDDMSAQFEAPLRVHEPVIRLRDAPYDGLFDCLVSVAREEGLGALWSAYWTTILFTAPGLSWRLIAGMRFTY